MDDACVRTNDQLETILSEFCYNSEKIDLIIHFHKDVERIEAERMAKLIAKFHGYTYIDGVQQQFLVFDVQDDKYPMLSKGLGQPPELPRLNVTEIVMCLWSRSGFR